MITVNGQKINIYNTDLRETLLNRIATALDTTSKYLYNLPVEGFQKNKSYIVTDLLKELKEDISEIKYFDLFLKNKNDIITEKKYNILEDLFIPYFFYNKQIDLILEQPDLSLSEQIFYISEMILENVKILKDKENSFIPTLIENRRKLKLDFEMKLNQEHLACKQSDKIASKFLNIQTQSIPKFTDFIIEKTTLCFSIPLKNLTLLELFNYIILNENIPFAYCNNYYKIFKNFSPPDKWGYIDWQDKIILKVNQKRVNTEKYKYVSDETIDLNNTLDNYVEVSIMPKNDIFYCEFSIILNKNDMLSEDDFIRRLFECFPDIKNINYTDRKEISVKGVFYFPKKRFNSYIFSDLIVLDPELSSIISINERNKITKKKKENANTGWVYFHFNHISTQPIWCGINEKAGDRKDQETKNLDENLFPHGEPYIRVVVSRAIDREKVKTFQEIFANILAIYEINKEHIIKEYQQFIPTFGNIKNYKLSNYKKTDLPEDIFVSGYSRLCPHIPIVVSDKEQINKLINEEYKTEENKGMYIIKFPKEESPKQKYYTCPEKKNERLFPGVQKNNRVQNQNEYPFTPCCFTQPQKDKASYLEYYHGIVDTKQKKQQELIITNKILNFNEVGVLPKDLKNFFNIMDPSSSYEYIRIGVGKSCFSFFVSVLMGLYDQNINLEGENFSVINEVDENKRKDKIKKICKLLSNDSICVLAKQNQFDTNVSYISKELQNFNQDIYLDCKKYIQLLEEYFNCNIFLFNTTGPILPRFKEGYYQNLRNEKMIFIYEHMGSEIDNSLYPQCELIIRWYSGTANTDYYFKNNEKVAENVKKVFYLLNDSYVLYKNINFISFPIFNFFQNYEISQFIDTYGKTRQIDLIFETKQNEKTLISVMTTPIPPLRCKCKKNDQINKTNIDTAFKLFDKLKIKPISQNIGFQNGISQLNGIFGNVKISAIIEEIPNNKIEDLAIEKTGIEIDNKKSSLAQYNKNKKIARYLSEYVYWVFSKYLQKLSIKNIDIDTLTNFSKNYFIIKPNYEYIIKSKIFRDNNILDQDKIIILNEEMKKRLLFMLRLKCTRQKNVILNYNERETIQDFYLDITDFDQFPNQMILYGEGSVAKWNFENNFKTNLNSELNLNTYSPYFIKNNLLSENTIYLAQNTSSLNDAITICLDWQKNKYNKTFVDTNEDNTNYEFTLFHYINCFEIKKYNVIGNKKSNIPINIIGSKKNGNLTFTSLLNLN